MPNLLDAQDRISDAADALDCVLDLLSGCNRMVQIDTDGLSVLLRHIAKDTREAQQLLQS